MSNTDVFGECQQRMGEWVHYQRRCEYDMCARADPADNTPVCVWVLALSRACKEIGVIVDWMSDPTLSATCQGKWIVNENVVVSTVNLSFYTAYFSCTALSTNALRVKDLPADSKCIHWCYAVPLFIFLVAIRSSVSVSLELVGWERASKMLHIHEHFSIQSVCTIHYRTVHYCTAQQYTLWSRASTATVMFYIVSEMYYR